MLRFHNEINVVPNSWVCMFELLHFRDEDSGKAIMLTISQIYCMGEMMIEGYS
jgi:hypothetical protein